MARKNHEHESNREAINNRQAIKRISKEMAQPRITRSVREAEARIKSQADLKLARVRSKFTRTPSG